MCPGRWAQKPDTPKLTPAMSCRKLDTPKVTPAPRATALNTHKITPACTWRLAQKNQCSGIYSRPARGAEKIAPPATHNTLLSSPILPTRFHPYLPVFFLPYHTFWTFPNPPPPNLQNTNNLSNQPPTCSPSIARMS